MGGERSSRQSVTGFPSLRARDLFRPSLTAHLDGAESRSMAIMGVLNVTPDSFSDGGRFHDADLAFAHGCVLIEEGAHIIDVGGESSRPPGKTYGAGFVEVSAEEEIARVVPVFARLHRETAAVLSVDTQKPAVARAALRAGARIVNDVSNGASLDLLEVAAETGAVLVLMHTRERGRIDARTTEYEDVVDTVLCELLEAVARAERCGVREDHIVIDPGIGFAKTARQSAKLLGNLDAFVATGYPVLVGASRKSFIAELSDLESIAGHERTRRTGPESRVGGSLAAVTAAALSGCAAVRVHDVAMSVQAARVAQAIRDGRGGAL